MFGVQLRKSEDKEESKSQDGVRREALEVKLNPTKHTPRTQAAIKREALEVKLKKASPRQKKHDVSDVVREALHVKLRTPRRDSGAAKTMSREDEHREGLKQLERLRKVPSTDRRQSRVSGQRRGSAAATLPRSRTPMPTSAPSWPKISWLPTSNALRRRFRVGTDNTP